MSKLMQPSPLATAEQEIARGERFAFGKNWSKFVDTIDDARLSRAMRSLQDSLGADDLCGLRFLDAGCGSGLFSLAASLLGADVVSFDFDPASVACTEALRDRHHNDRRWRIESGSILDRSYLESLGSFDIVYSWGVIHHTGQMWGALDNLCERVAPNGKLFVAIYNDQGWASTVWKQVKRAYCALPRGLRPVVLAPALLRLWGPTIARDTLRGHPLRSWRNYGSARGMSAWRDVIDWVGGYPFEVATPHQVVAFADDRGLSLGWTEQVGRGSGCNEFVFARRDPQRAELLGPIQPRLEHEH